MKSISIAFFTSLLGMYTASTVISWHSNSEHESCREKGIRLLWRQGKNLMVMTVKADGDVSDSMVIKLDEAEIPQHILERSAFTSNGSIHTACALVPPPYDSPMHTCQLDDNQDCALYARTNLDQKYFTVYASTEPVVDDCETAIALREFATCRDTPLITDNEFVRSPSNNVSVALQVLENSERNPGAVLKLFNADFKNGHIISRDEFDPSSGRLEVVPIIHSLLFLNDDHLLFLEGKLDHDQNYSHFRVVNCKWKGNEIQCDRSGYFLVPPQAYKFMSGNIRVRPYGQQYLISCNSGLFRLSDAAMVPFFNKDQTPHMTLVDFYIL